MLAGLDSLVMLTVMEVEVLRPSLDLWIGFDGGIRLRIFCDREDCYHLSAPDGVYAVPRPGEALIRPAWPADVGPEPGGSWRGHPERAWN